MITWIRQDGSKIQTNEQRGNIDFAIRHGWVREGEEPEFIRPVDQQDYKAMINALETKDEIETYVIAITGIDIDKRGKLDTVKAKAIKAVEAYHGDSANAD